VSVRLTRSAIDVGVVITDPERMLAFYRDLLGFELVAERTTAIGDTMYRLACGDAVIKLLLPNQPPQARSVPGNTRAQTGFRYITLSISNLDEIVAQCEAAGCRFAVPPRPSTSGGRYAQVEDPEGNVVELVEAESD
jgi:catechol 2,3-dioxygenase-like lactoylglutathione lyase family enzyme